MMVPLALLVLTTGCASSTGQGGISYLKTMQFRPDAEVIQLCDTTDAGMDAYQAISMRLKDVRRIRMDERAIVSPLIVYASGPLGDRLLSGSGPGQLLRLNGESDSDRFVTDEIFLPTDKIDQAIVGAAIRWASRGVCDPAKSEPVARIEAPAEDPAVESHLMPIVRECSSVVRRLRAELFLQNQVPACSSPAVDQALSVADEFLANNPIR